MLKVRDLRFYMTVRGQLLAIEIKTDSVTCSLEKGTGLVVSTGTNG